jgi:glycosyltransferase involved in cell wall biosynthesis
MKIAVISMIRDPWGGSEELWYEMAKEALQQGHSVSHLSYALTDVHPKIKELISLGMQEYKRPSFYSSSANSLVKLLEKVIFYFKKRANRSIHNIFANKPDVVLYNGTCYSIVQEKRILKYLQKSKCRFFILGHFIDENNPPTHQEKIIINRAYIRCETIFFVSERTKKVAEQQLSRKIDHAYIIRNPVNLTDRSLIPFSSDEKVQMAMVGNLVMIHKGQDIVLHILAKEKNETQNWHLNIYGNGVDENYLKQLTRELGLNDFVTFHGKVNDIRAIWKKNHLLLMPSRMEGMPLAIVEAMLCGRIVIATDVGGNCEWIDTNINGFLAERADEVSFKKSMQQAFHRKEDWVEIGKLAHKKASQLFDPESGKTLLRLISS